MVTSSRSVTLGFAGEVEYQQTFTDPDSGDGLGINQVVNVGGELQIGVAVPSGSVALTIIPPPDLTYEFKLQSALNSDGFLISSSRITSVGLNPATTIVVFGLVSEFPIPDLVVPMRLIWS